MMMSNNILEQRRQCFVAWNTSLSQARTFPPHPRHDPNHLCTLREEYGEVPTRPTFDLDLELAAWDEASDDDFERFEQSLE